MGNPILSSADNILISMGFEKTSDSVYLFEKILPNNNPLNESEETQLKIIVHTLYNVPSFAIVFPDGGMLNLNIKNFAQLPVIEAMINFYDPSF